MSAPTQFMKWGASMWDHNKSSHNYFAQIRPLKLQVNRKVCIADNLGQFLPTQYEKED